MCVFCPFSWIFPRLQMRVLVVIVLLAGALGMGTTHAASGTAHFSITPGIVPYANMVHRGYFTYSSQPDSLIQDSIQVTNVGTARGSVDLYAVDATTRQTSGVVFLDPEAPHQDVGAWITLSSQKVTLNPGQSQEVPFSLRVPSKVRPGQHGGGIIARDAIDQTSSSNTSSIQTSVQVHMQEILGVLVTLPGPDVEKLSVTGITYNRQNTSQNLLIGLANTGTQMLHPSGSLQISTKKGLVQQMIPMKLAAILPQTAINYPVTINPDTLNNGIYIASITLRYEGGYTVNYAADFVVFLPQAATSQNPPKPLKNQETIHTLSKATYSKAQISSLTTLTPWHYIAGLLSIMLIFVALLLVGRRRYKPQTKLRQKL